jgi:capsular exopolysaccharide synthesis family protein
MIGFVFSLTFGVGLALLLEFLDRSIKSADGLSHRLQLPALAIIPTFTRKEARVLRGKSKGKLKLPAVAAANGDSAVNGDAHGSLGHVWSLGKALPREPKLISLGGRSPAHEAYRMLRTSIIASESGAGIKAKTWLITSSQPAEGKTTTAINVAMSIAHLGRSVLIVDCDLRRPTAHKRLRVDQEPGLSTYLSGEVELENAIQKLDIPGLSFMASGAIPYNPCDMIGSKKMKEMVETLSNLCDYIVFDSPPLILADPLILSTIVDSVILVVNGGKSNWEAMSLARQELSNVGANVFGVVLNDVAAKNIPYYGHYS